MRYVGHINGHKERELQIRSSSGKVLVKQLQYLPLILNILKLIIMMAPCYKTASDPGRRRAHIPGCGWVFGVGQCGACFMHLFIVWEICEW
jgi:hypothetical protein